MTTKKKIDVTGFFILLPADDGSPDGSPWVLTRAKGVTNWNEVVVVFNPALTDQTEVITIQLDADSDWYFVDPSLLSFSKPWDDCSKTSGSIQVSTCDTSIQSIIDNESAQAGIVTSDANPPIAALVNEDNQKSKTMTLTFPQPPINGGTISVDLQWIAYEVTQDGDTTVYSAFMSDDPTFKRRNDN